MMMNGDGTIYVIPNPVSDEDNDDEWFSDDVNNVEYTIEYFGSAEVGAPEGECLIVSPMTFQFQDNLEDYTEYEETPKLDTSEEIQPEEEYFEEIPQDNDSNIIISTDSNVDNITQQKEETESAMNRFQDNYFTTNMYLLEYKAKYSESMRKIEESIESRISETALAIQQAVEESFTELQNTINTQQIELDMEQSLRESAESENESLQAQIIVMKKQIDEDAQTFTDLLEENEKLKHEVKQFREKNVSLKQIDFERQKEVQRLKGDIALQQLEYKDMIDENKRGKKKEEVFKLEKKQLATQKKVLSRELDIHFYRNSITGNSFDKTSVDSMKEVPVSTREIELEHNVQIYRKRMELLQPNLDTLKELFLEQIGNMKELVEYSKKLVQKLEDETTTKIELRKSIKKDFDKEHLRMEYQRLTRYDSDEEEFNAYYNDQDKQYNRILRDKDKQLQVFRVAYDTVVEKTDERRQVLEVEFNTFLQMVKDLQQPKIQNEEEIIENLLKRSSSATLISSATSSSSGKRSPMNSPLSIAPPKSFMISRFQKDAVKNLQGRKRSQSSSDLLRKPSSLDIE